MVRAWIFVTVIGLVTPSVTMAQAPRFKWVAGQTLVYKVSQTTTASEKVGDKSGETTTKLDLIKKWSVGAVDANGVATLTMSLDKLRMETKTPASETMLFDSEAKDKSTPGMAEEMSKYVGVPLIVVRLDPRGQMVEVKECKFGAANRLEADLPFKITLPPVPFAVEGAWERKYQIKLDSQSEAGESYAAVQKFTCKSMNGGQATIAVNTLINGLPASPADQIPLIPMQPIGEVVFDTAAGRLKSVRYKWSKEIVGHQGEGGKYSFATAYVEELQ
jgi:hypothetical protein